MRSILSNEAPGSSTKWRYGHPSAFCCRAKARSIRSRADPPYASDASTPRRALSNLTAELDGPPYPPEALAAGALCARDSHAEPVASTHRHPLAPLVIAGTLADLPRKPLFGPATIVYRKSSYRPGVASLRVIRQRRGAIFTRRRRARSSRPHGLPEPSPNVGTCNRLPGASLCGRTICKRSSEATHTDRITQFVS